MSKGGKKSDPLMPQDYNNVICINDWLPDDSAYYQKGYYPEGSRDKAIYFSPANVEGLPLRPKWRYLLKESRGWAPWQFWMEVMAYRIGQVMGVHVPPAYVGLRNEETTGKATYGALIEWFYGEEDESWVEGARLIKPLIPEFNDKTGSGHNLKTILDHPLFTEEEPNADANRRDWIAYWAKVLTFDTVIGNVDRHPENWGIIIPRKEPSGSSFKAKLTPAFDNGTSMSYEQPEKNFGLFDKEQHVVRYLTRSKKARHHMKWSLEDQDDMHFFDFMKRFVSTYPETREMIMGMLGFTKDDLLSRLEPLVSIEVEERSRLTRRRFDFTLTLIMKRTELLLDALEKA